MAKLNTANIKDARIASEVQLGLCCTKLLKTMKLVGEDVEGISTALHLGSGYWFVVIMLMSSMSQRSTKKKKSKMISGGGSKSENRIILG